MNKCCSSHLQNHHHLGELAVEMVGGDWCKPPQHAKGVGGCSSPLTTDVISPGQEEVATLVVTYPNA